MEDNFNAYRTHFIKIDFNNYINIDFVPLLEQDEGRTQSCFNEALIEELYKVLHSAEVLSTTSQT